MKKTKILSALMAIAITATPTIANTLTNSSKLPNHLLQAYAEDDIEYKQDEDGKWYYYKNGEILDGWNYEDGLWWYYEKGEKFRGGMKEIDGKFYYFNFPGWMATHWVELNSGMHYFGSDGAARIGWVRIANDFIGLDKEDLYDNELESYDEWFYFEDGFFDMVTGFKKIDGEEYFFVPRAMMIDGIMTSLEYLLDGKPEGYMYRGKLELGDKTYYFDKNGAMCTGWREIDGDWYYFNDKGVMQTGWVKDKGKWYYLKNDGSMKIGWLNDGNFRYYLLSDGSMCTGWKQIDNNWHYFSSGGVMKKGWLEDNGKSFYLDETGKMVTGAAMINNRFYYFDEYGKLQKDCDVTIDGKKYHANDKGELTKVN